MFSAERLVNVSPSAFARLYRAHIARDFAPEERRPLFGIRRLFARGLYQCLALTGRNRLLAYACFLQDKQTGPVLLDYFAVNPALRGSGVGGRFLAVLRAQTGRDILIESELPAAAGDFAERETRLRRVRFYTRAGALPLPLGWRAFGIDYRLLLLPAPGAAPGAMARLAAGQAVAKLYRYALPTPVLKRCTRLYPLPVTQKERGF